jgi:hypothetical protein
MPCTCHARRFRLRRSDWLRFVQVIPEGAGRGQEGFCALFSGVWSRVPGSGHAKIRPVTWPGLDPGVACFRSLPFLVSGRAGSRTPGRSPGRVSGAAGVLEAVVRDPDDGRRERARCGVVFRPHGAALFGQAPGCGHPFGVPAVPGRGGMGRSACGQRDQSEARPRRPGAGARPAGDHALPVSGPAHAACAALREARDLTSPSRIA